jgi:hypothetical protein
MNPSPRSNFPDTLAKPRPSVGETLAETLSESRLP